MPREVTGRATPIPADPEPPRPRSVQRWRPRSLSEGTDPDPRFTLANERTFLAWMRTAMALVAGAVGFDAFGSGTVGETVHLVLVLGMLAGAAALSAFAFARWLGVEAAMRRGRSLPFPLLAAVVAVLVVGAALILFAAMAFR